MIHIDLRERDQEVKKKGEHQLMSECQIVLEKSSQESSEVCVIDEGD